MTKRSCGKNACIEKKRKKDEKKTSEPSDAEIPQARPALTFLPKKQLGRKDADGDDDNNRICRNPVCQVILLPCQSILPCTYVHANPVITPISELRDQLLLTTMQGKKRKQSRYLEPRLRFNPPDLPQSQSWKSAGYADAAIVARASQADGRVARYFVITTIRFRVIRN